MASGGMYDHIGGGFARYSVDREWLVPHFEKMLYDQALLVRVYAHAAVALGEPRWRQVVAETVELRAARPAPARRWVLLGRGRRLPGSRRARPRGPVPHVDRRRGARGARRGRRRRARLVGHHGRRATSRDVRSPTASTRGASCARPPTSRTPAGACSRRASCGHGRGSTTRCSPSGTRCWSRRWPRPGRCSASRRGSTPPPPPALPAHRAARADGRW